MGIARGVSEVDALNHAMKVTEGGHWQTAVPRVVYLSPHNHGSRPRQSEPPPNADHSNDTDLAHNDHTIISRYTASHTAIQLANYDLSRQPRHRGADPDSNSSYYVYGLDVDFACAARAAMARSDP